MKRLIIAVHMMDPVGILVGHEGIFRPFRVGKPEGHIIGQPIVSQKKFQALAPGRLIYIIGASPSEDFIRPFRQDDAVAHFFHGLCKIIVIDQFGMSKRLPGLTEEGHHFFLVQRYLLFKLPQGKEKGERMVVCFVEEFDASRIGKSFEAVQDIHPVLFKLINDGARDGIGNPEISPVPLDQIQHDPVGREIAFFGDLVEDRAVFFFVLVVMVMVDVEKRIVPQSTGLMDLEVKTDAWHIDHPQDW
jgi:hypothetical protein